MKKNKNSFDILSKIEGYISEEKKLEKGDFLFTEGVPNDYIYYLVEGAIKIFKKGCVIWIAKPGELIGLTSNLNNTSSYTFSSKAHENCVVVGIKTDVFNKILLQDVEFSRYIIAVLCDRITLTEKKTKKFLELSSMQRLASELLVSLKEKGSRFIVSFTLSDLSEILGVSKRLVSSMLNELEKAAVIERLKDELVVLNLKKLKSMVE